MTEVTRERHDLGFVSGIQLEGFGGDITPASLKWLETNISSFKIRPNIASPSNDLLDCKHFKNFEKSASCCEFQPVRKIDVPLTTDEKELVLKEVERIKKYYLGSPSQSADSS